MICEKFTGRPFPVKFFQYNGSEYCLDPCKPKILRVTPEVRQVLEYMQQSDSPAHEHIKTQGSVVTEQIAKIQGEGFFNGSLPIVKSDDHAVNRICLIVTSSCNFRCRYCYYDNDFNNGRNELMSKEVAIKAVDFLCQNSMNKLLEIDFFGGEPFLNFGIIKTVVEYCATKSRRFTYYVTTNGSLITSDIAAFLKQNNFTVIVSLDGPEDVHNHVRQFAGGQPTFDNVLHGLSILKAALPVEKLTVNAVVTKNYPHADMLLNFFHGIGISRLAITTATVPEKPDLHMANDSMKTFTLSEKQIFSRMLDSSISNDTKYLPILQYMRFLNKGIPRPYRCSVGRGTLAINLDGTIYACHRFVGMSDFALGNLWDGVEETRRKRYFNLHEQVDKTCTGCWARYLCGGPCIYDSFACYGNIQTPAPYKCDRIRNLIELSAIIYGELATHDKSRLVGLLS